MHRRREATSGARNDRLDRMGRAQLFGQLGAMISVGISLPAALEALADKGATPGLRGVAATLARRLNRGENLQAAMASLPQAFEPIHVYTVEAGLSGGRLPQVLGDLAAWEERDLALTRAVTGSLVYPMAVLAIGTGLAFYLGSRVFSGIVPTLVASGKPLPLITRGLLVVTEGMQNPFVLLAVFGILAGCARLFGSWRKTPLGRQFCDRTLLSLPVLGGLVRYLFVGRFCGHMSLMSQSGIPVLDALRTATSACANTFLRESLTEVADCLKEGGTLSQGLARSGQFPRLAIGMLTVGDETGRTKFMLERLARLYDAEVYDVLDRLTKLLEPMIICFMGAVVGIVVVGTLLPIYQLMND